MQLGRLLGEVGGEADAYDGVQVRVEEGFELRRELREEVEPPLVAGEVAALDKVIVGFVGEEAVRASIVVSGFACVQSAADGEFFPSELREESLGARVFRVDGVTSVPVDAPESFVGPKEAGA